MKQESTVDLLLDVDQRPSAGKGILLSFQHVFAMFGATILVPLILGMPVSVAPNMANTCWKLRRIPLPAEGR